MGPSDLRDRESAETLSSARWLLQSWQMSGLLELPGPRGDTGASALDQVSLKVQACRGCRLHSGRKHVVFGEGSAAASLVFIGEAPGATEDEIGRPFVGRAGKLLDKMIAAMGLRRESVYICNTLKCRPPDNRTPQQDEVEACARFLLEQIDVIQPRVICTLGRSAVHALLGSTEPFSKIHGKVLLWRGIPLVPVYHPAYLLRNPAQKAAVWQALKEVMRLLGATGK